MERKRVLPFLAAGLCIPGIALRAAHLWGGFEIGTGLPVTGDWRLYALIAFFIVSAAALSLCALPLRRDNHTPFETLLGTRTAGFRTVGVLAGLLLIAGGVYYLYLTWTVAEQDAASWAKALEMVYAIATVLAGASVVGLTRAQGADEISEAQAKLTLAPLMWSCLHLLVTYRMTCVDPKLPSFAFGLLADVGLVLGFYHIARLLYGKPRPALLGFFGALAAVMVFSDLGGYGVSYAMGMRAVVWDAKTLVRSGLAAAGCMLLLAEVFVLTRKREHDGEST